MPGPHPHRDRALADLQNGDSVRTVADRYGLSTATLRSWKKRYLSEGATLPQPVAQPVAPSVAQPVAPEPPASSNVLPLNRSGPAPSSDRSGPPRFKRRKRGGKTTDPKERQKKLEHYHQQQYRARLDRRARALGPVDRESLKRIVRRLVAMQEEGLWCPACAADTVNRVDDRGEDQPNTLTPGELLKTTRALHLNLDKLGPLLEVEDRLSDNQPSQTAGMAHYRTPEGMAQLANSLCEIGPRLLASVLSAHSPAMDVLETALIHAKRQTG